MCHEQRDLPPDIAFKDISAFIFLKLFLTTVSDTIKHWLQVVLKRDIEEKEIMLFIQAELYIHLYYTSPQKYFEERRKKLYPSASLGISESTYKLFMRALSTSCHMHFYTPEDEWRAIFSVDEDLQKMVSRFGERCIELCFENGLTWVTVDDDQMRLRSRKITQAG